ncbi:glycoside hydrolase 43 family protein [Glycomyces sp. TRM65418]|uniref:glycoside hydrolase family 43 protein n=1 Tax=Glycomyces sp. TRM65418 TaxID=2867006 RepID=UPI001CE6D10A|nr:glycoside hydrolase 43 family protein [Glycomyces sp. TRM65418]MCC3765640.1 glycoside hydrolase 43 family protein [Glycomyces sp. TRM65418]QZD55238.1 glycoside hydrolase 43 family protein [Glycomyces sp. TRM65418]
MTNDGVYRNPVLNADWSDPDAIRVGGDFYMTASSFHRVPGLPLLRSRDLVHWTLIGHALDRLAPEADFRTPQRGGGVWAPAIRHHAGRYWIVYPDPDRGLFVTSAEHPEDQWTRPHLLKGGKGLIDPCPLWADDGSAYLVHGWAKSRSGICNRLTVHRMSEDAAELLDEGTVAIDGDALPGYRTLEGPKFYQRDGWYWIFAPAGGVAEGWQSVFRSRDPFGPYEGRIVLEQGDTDVNGPHQGAWVTTEDGSDWFLHFQDRGPFGRVVHLQPMRWSEDGWPEIGDRGTPVATGNVPVPGGTATEPPEDFADGIGPQWSWQANPEPHWAAAGPRLRLACVDTGTADLRHLPNLLGRRLPGDPCRVTTALRLDGAEPGARAGLAVVGETYAWIGLERHENGIALVHRTADDGVEADAAHAIAVDDRPVTLGVDVDAEGRCRFFTGTPPRPVGPPFQATAGAWVGAALGLFAIGNGRDGTGEFDAVRISAHNGSADGR